MKMSKKMIEIISRNRVYIAIFLIGLYINMHITNSLDDKVFNVAIYDYGSLQNWIDVYYKSWSGRIVPHALFIILLGFPDIVYRVINTMAFTALIKVIIEVAKTDMRINKILEKCETIIALILMILIYFVSDKEMFNYALIWKCASVLYLWGLVCALVVILAVLKKYNGINVKKSLWCVVVPAAVYCCGFEQTAALVIAFVSFLFIACIIKNRKVDFSLAALTIFTCVLGIVCISAPGNSVRVKFEIMDSFNDYQMYSLFDRIVMAVSYMLTILNKYCLWEMILLAIGARICMFMSERKSKVKNVIASIPIIYYSLKLLAGRIEGTFADGNCVIDINRYLYDYIDVESASFRIPIWQITSTFIGLMAISIIIITLFAYVGEKRDIITVLFVAAAICELLAVAMTPSIHVSGARMVFVSYVLLIISLLIVFLNLCCYFMHGINREI